jgi:sec-independent protein translocase protein TatC
VSPAKQRRSSSFERAADGSMTLIEHIRELRSRLLKATLGVIAGTLIAYAFASRLEHFIVKPYCDYYVASHGADNGCQLTAATVLAPFMIQLKIALYVGLAISSPIWLYQVWAFIAPGLHKRERRYTYAFVGAAVPLFVLGMAGGYELFSRSVKFLLGISSGFTIQLDITGYFDFLTSVMLFFGLGFEVPVVVTLLNFVGVVSAKRLLGWWRPAVFLMFLFGAIFTPTPDPFGMTILALCMSMLYFGAVGVAFLNDRRKARRRAETEVPDDEISPIEPVSPVDAATWGVHGSPDQSDDR